MAQIETTTTPIHAVSSISALATSMIQAQQHQRDTKGADSKNMVGVETRTQDGGRNGIAMSLDAEAKDSNTAGTEDVYSNAKGVCDGNGNTISGHFDGDDLGGGKVDSKKGINEQVQSGGAGGSGGIDIVVNVVDGNDAGRVSDKSGEIGLRAEHEEEIKGGGASDAGKEDIGLGAGKPNNISSGTEANVSSPQPQPLTSQPDASTSKTDSPTPLSATTALQPQSSQPQAGGLLRRLTSKIRLGRSPHAHPNLTTPAAGPSTPAPNNPGPSDSKFGFMKSFKEREQEARDADALVHARRVEALRARGILGSSKRYGDNVGFGGWEPAGVDVSPAGRTSFNASADAVKAQKDDASSSMPPSVSTTLKPPTATPSSMHPGSSGLGVGDAYGLCPEIGVQGYGPGTGELPTPGKARWTHTSSTSSSRDRNRPRGVRQETDNARFAAVEAAATMYAPKTSSRSPRAGLLNLYAPGPGIGLGSADIAGMVGMGPGMGMGPGTGMQGVGHTGSAVSAADEVKKAWLEKWTKEKEKEGETSEEKVETEDMSEPGLDVTEVGATNDERSVEEVDEGVTSVRDVGAKEEPISVSNRKVEGRLEEWTFPKPTPDANPPRGPDSVSKGPNAIPSSVSETGAPEYGSEAPKQEATATLPSNDDDDDSKTPSVPEPTQAPTAPQSQEVAKAVEVSVSNDNERKSSGELCGPQTDTAETSNTVDWVGVADSSQDVVFSSPTEEKPSEEETKIEPVAKLDASNGPTQSLEPNDAPVNAKDTHSETERTSTKMSANSEKGDDDDGLNLPPVPLSLSRSVSKEPPLDPISEEPVGSAPVIGRRKTLNIFGRKKSLNGTEEKDSAAAASRVSSLQSLKRSVTSGFSAHRNARTSDGRSKALPPPIPVTGRSNSTGKGSSTNLLSPNTMSRSISSPSMASSSLSPASAASRKPLSPTMHSHGSIVESAGEIEDDESRRLSEMAFMY